MKKYKIRFEYWGRVLFLVIMVPNFIWFSVPAPNDILRVNSLTPAADTVGSICQAVFVAACCMTANTHAPKIRFSKLITFTAAMVMAYFAGWVFYYNGIANRPIILTLTLCPCMAFIRFAADRKNLLALIPAVIFTLCHIFYRTVNFIIN